MEKLENLYDLQDKFRRVTNFKTQISSMQYEVITLGKEANPQNVNLGVQCSPDEKATFIKLFENSRMFLHGHMTI